MLPVAMDCPFLIALRYFRTFINPTGFTSSFVGFVLLILLLFFVVFYKSLFVICPLSFTIVSTFRGCVFSCPDIFFLYKTKIRLYF